MTNTLARRSQFCHSVAMLNASQSAVRTRHVALVSAFARHLEATPDADPHAGLMALVLHVQGEHEQLDDDERALLETLTAVCSSEVRA